MKTLEFTYDCDLFSLEKLTFGMVDDLVQKLNDELDYQEAVSVYYVETFDELKGEASSVEACEYDYAMELIQAYAYDRSRILLFGSLGLISSKDRDSYLETIDACIALCKRFLRESAIWKG